MYGLTETDFRRVQSAVQWTERERSNAPHDVSSGPLRPNEMWVRTPASLPGGYDGTDALEGVGVFRLADGTDHDLNTIWIKDTNGSALEADKVYRGVINGILTQGGDTYSLYLVQAQSSTSTPTLEYVLPWKWVDVTFNPPLYGSSFTQKGLIYTKIEQALNPKSGAIPDLGNMEAPGEDYWIGAAHLNTPDVDTTPYYCVQGDPLPVYSDSNTAFLSTSSSTYYEGATAAAWYLKNMGFALPKVHSKFSLSGATVAKYGGGSLPIYANDDMNAISYYANPADVNAKPFLATVKYKSMSGVIWGVTSNVVTWKNSGGTTKDLYFWFWDGMGLLANTASDQQVLVTPICKTKMDSGFTDYESSGKTNGDVLYLITNKF